MPDGFIGRIQELRLLRQLRKTSEARLAVVYGRRRVGKSSLIREAYRDQTLLTLEGLENRPTAEQIRNFVRQLREHFPDAALSEPRNWHQALRVLGQELASKPSVVLLDEFQWMANYRQELVSVLKLIWDQHLSRIPGLTLVLCGSVASFMVNKVIRSRALYGRVHQPIHLKGFQLSETHRLLSEKSVQESLQAQILVGGVPGYLKLLETKGSVTLGVQELAFSGNGFFTGEFDRIFVSQFGKSDMYEKIVRALSSRPAGLRRKQLTELKEIKNGGNLSRHLSDLELAGLISSYYSFQHGPQAKVRLYRLSDPYLRLYLQFIEPLKPQIEAGVPNLFVRLSGSPRFSAWKGLAAELLCYEHRYPLSRLMGFSDVDYEVGPFFQAGGNRDGVQIDLVYDRKDHVLTVCEIKFTDRPIAPTVVDEVDRKLELLPNPKGKTIQKALLTRAPATDALRDRAYFNHIVELKNLAHVDRD